VLVSARDDDRSGEIVAGYRLERVLGQGGMGVVYLARSVHGERLAAIKLVAPELSRDRAFRERFARESRMARVVEHPNIVRVQEAGEIDGLLYILMQYIAGSDLRALIERRGRLDPDRAVEIIAEVAGALDAAHSKGLLHRDVKPANILIAQVDGQAYLADFGLATQTGSLTQMTRTGHWVGTVDYIAPERIEGKPDDARTDVYSLGCVLYQALTGELPFPKDSDIAKMFAHVNDPPPAPRAVAADLPSGFDDVIQCALAKNPADRYATAGELAAAATAAATGGDPPAVDERTRTGEVLPQRSAPGESQQRARRSFPRRAKRRTQRTPDSAGETSPVTAPVHLGYLAAALLVVIGIGVAIYLASSGQSGGQPGCPPPASSPASPPAAAPTGQPAPEQILVCVASQSINGDAFDHWMKVASSSSSTGAKAAVPEPPNYTACIASAKAAKPAKGQKAPTEAELKSHCATEYKSLQSEVLGFLISTQWVIGEASALGVKLSDQEVKKDFVKIKTQQFPKPADFQKFLATSGQSVSDLLLRVKLTLLSSKIQQKLAKGKGKFVKEFKAKWKAQTYCASQYAVADCGHVQNAPL
jgi:serine/threonine protein kinase